MAGRSHHGGPGARQPRAWQRMLSGRRLDLLDPAPADIEIEDIAHGLARVARWNGQTLGPHAFSVAQHSLLVEAVISEGAPADGAGSVLRLAALLHDAPEYVIGDLISPFKAAIGLDYRAFEHRLLGAIHMRFGLPDTLPSEMSTRIKAADRTAAYYEATRLAGFAEDEARQFFGVPPPLGAPLAARLASLAPQSPTEAGAAYLARFGVLVRAVHCGGTA